MAGRLVVEKVSLKNLQAYHHMWLNTFGEQETLIEAVSARPGFFGPNPVAFLSLVTRRPSLKWQDLDEALINDRTLIRAPAFRGSLFLLSSQDYGIYFRTFSQYLQNRGFSKLMEDGFTKNHLYYFYDLLKAHGVSLPLSQNELIGVIFHNRPRPDALKSYRIIQKLCDMGFLVRVNAKGFKGNDFTYALMEKWLPELSLKPDNPETARCETVRRYLAAYGPSTIDDISWWTGLPELQCQRAVGFLRREVVRFSIEGYKEDMLGLRETADQLKKKLLVDDTIQLLPSFDPYTLGWRCRRRCAEKEHMPYIFDRFGNGANVIVESGKIIGLWQFRDGENNLLEYHIFNKFADKKNMAIPKIEEWARLLCDLNGGQMPNIVERHLPKPLHERGDNAFIWPLGKNLEASVKIVSSVIPKEKRVSNTFRHSYLDNEYLVRGLNESQSSRGMLHDEGHVSEENAE